MATRAMGPMAGVGWLTRAVNVGRSGPGAVFGGAALLTLVVLAAGFAAGMLQVALVPALGNGIAALMIGTVTVGVLVLVVVSMVLIGFLRLLHRVESGQSARALEVFAGFRDPRTSLKTIGFFLLLAIAQNALLVALLMAFAGGFVEWYMQTLQVSMAGGQPDMTELPSGTGIATLAMVVVGLLVYGAQAIGLGQIVLRGRGVFAAIGDGVVGVSKNLLPLLVFAIVCLLAALVLTVGVLLVAMLIGLMAKFVGTWLGLVLAVPLYIAAMLVMFVVMFGAMYHLWRDVCGAVTPGSDAAVSGVTPA